MIYAKKHELPKAKNTLPSSIRKKAELQSGISLHDIRIDYQSTEPKRFGAHALTYGNNIYISPGKGDYLEHEIGHAIQHKVIQVPCTGIERGVPVNNDRIVEQKAIPSNYAGKQEIKHAFPVIQKAKASVTLSLADNNYEFAPDEILVDSINLPKRFPTALPSGNQGDHTIADVLVKRSQKHVVMGKNLAIGLDYYYANTEELLNIVNSYKNDNGQGDAYNLNTKNKCVNTLVVLNKVRGMKINLYGWNIIFKQVIQGYNEAYATSILTTSIGSSGSRNEANAMARLKNGRIEKGEEADDQTLLQLLDLDSVDRIKGSIEYTSDDRHQILRTEYMTKLQNRIAEIKMNQPYTDMSLSDIIDQIKFLCVKKKKTQKEEGMIDSLLKAENILERVAPYQRYFDELQKNDPIHAYLIDKTLELMDLEAKSHDEEYLKYRVAMKKNTDVFKHLHELVGIFKNGDKVINEMRAVLIVILDRTRTERVFVSEDLERSSQEKKHDVKNEFNKIGEALMEVNEQPDDSKIISSILSKYKDKLHVCINNHTAYLEKYSSICEEDYNELAAKCGRMDELLNSYINKLDNITTEYNEGISNFLLNDQSIQEFIMNLQLHHHSQLPFE